MKFLRFHITLVVCAFAAHAQTPAATRVIGEVTSVDAGARSIVLKGDDGRSVNVSLTEKTLFLRVPPGEKDLQKAARIQLSDVQPGDRVLARGKAGDDASALSATSVIVMTRADLTQKQERDREEWQKRGVAGRVTAVDAAARRLTISTRTAAGPEPVNVEWSDKTAFRRYAPDSVRFDNARPGAASDIQTGDQVRILGDREGDLVKAEQVVSGSFKQVAGTVTAVNAQAGEIRITDLATKKPLTVRVNADSTLKKLPPEAAAMMARRMNAAVSARGGAAVPGPDRAAPAHARGGPDMQQMMERLPGFSLGDLKPGDALIVASTAGADPGRVTAITVVAGVEPLLTAAPERATSFGGWNFGEIGLPQ